MAISLTLKQYLDDQHVPYDTLKHQLSATSGETAEVAHVPGARLIKAVVVKAEDTYMLALLPASHHINLDMLRDTLGCDVELVAEAEFANRFKDCETGAVPALGMAYNMDVIVDRTLVDVGDILFEGGDHRTLVHMRAPDFEKLVADSVHGLFSRYDKHPEKRGGFRFSHS